MSVAGKYLGIFVDEGRDLIKRVGTRLLRIEEEPGDIGALESALRMVHTLKGSSKMVGLDNVSRASHSLENVLKEFSTGARDLLHDDVSLLLGLLDQMDNVLTLVATGRAEEGRQLNLAIKTDAPPAKAEPEPQPVPRPPRSGVVEKPERQRSEPTQPVVEQSKPPPADGIRVQIERIDRLQEQVEDLIVQKWEIFAGLDRLQSYFGNTDRLGRHIRSKARTITDEGSFTARDLVSFSEEIHKMASIMGEMQISIMELRMVPLADLFVEYKRLVRDLALTLGKEVTLKIEGEETEVDRNLM